MILGFSFLKGSYARQQDFSNTISFGIKDFGPGIDIAHLPSSRPTSSSSYLTSSSKNYSFQHNSSTSTQDFNFIHKKFQSDFKKNYEKNSHSSSSSSNFDSFLHNYLDEDRIDPLEELLKFSAPYFNTTFKTSRERRAEERMRIQLEEERKVQAKIQAKKDELLPKIVHRRFQFIKEESQQDPVIDTVNRSIELKIEQEKIKTHEKIEQLVAEHVNHSQFGDVFPVTQEFWCWVGLRRDKDSRDKNLQEHIIDLYVQEERAIKKELSGYTKKGPEKKETQEDAKILEQEEKLKTFLFSESAGNHGAQSGSSDASGGGGSGGPKKPDDDKDDTKNQQNHVIVVVDQHKPSAATFINTLGLTSHESSDHANVSTQLNNASKKVHQTIARNEYEKRQELIRNAPKIFPACVERIKKQCGEDSRFFKDGVQAAFRYGYKGNPYAKIVTFIDIKTNTVIKEMVVPDNPRLVPYPLPTNQFEHNHHQSLERSMQKAEQSHTRAMNKFESECAKSLQNFDKITALLAQRGIDSYEHLLPKEGKGTVFVAAGLKDGHPIRDQHGAYYSKDGSRWTFDPIKNRFDIVTTNGSHIFKTINVDSVPKASFQEQQSFSAPSSSSIPASLDTTDHEQDNHTHTHHHRTDDHIHQKQAHSSDQQSIDNAIDGSNESSLLQDNAVEKKIGANSSEKSKYERDHHASSYYGHGYLPFQTLNDTKPAVCLKQASTVHVQDHDSGNAIKKLLQEMQAYQRQKEKIQTEHSLSDDVFDQRMHDRNQALQESEHQIEFNQYTYTPFEMDPEVRGFMQAYNFDESVFTQNYATSIQHCLMHEMVDILASCSDISYRHGHDSFVGQFVHHTADLVVCGQRLNQQSHIAQAAAITDTAHFFKLYGRSLADDDGSADLQAFQAFGCGIYDGTLNALSKWSTYLQQAYIDPQHASQELFDSLQTKADMLRRCIDDGIFGYWNDLVDPKNAQSSGSYHPIHERAFRHARLIGQSFDQAQDVILAMSEKSARENIAGVTECALDHALIGKINQCMINLVSKAADHLVQHAEKIINAMPHDQSCNPFSMHHTGNQAGLYAQGAVEFAHSTDYAPAAAAGAGFFEDNTFGNMTHYAASAYNANQKSKNAGGSSGNDSARLKENAGLTWNDETIQFFENLKKSSLKEARVNRFGNFYKNRKTQLWWSKDHGLHGGLHYKVFKETSKGFIHQFNADLLGNQIIGQHKGPIGAFISYKDIIFKS